MPKTSSDVVTRALRALGITGLHEDPATSDSTEAKAVLAGIFAELTGIQGATITWTVEAVPDEIFLPMASLVAYELRSVYPLANAAAIPPRSRSMGQVRAYLFPNNIADSRDYDSDGTVTTDEAETAKQAAFY